MAKFCPTLVRLTGLQLAKQILCATHRSGYVLDLKYAKSGNGELMGFSGTDWAGRRLGWSR